MWLVKTCVYVQGLDPASRRNLWDVVRDAKAGRGIILTTHNMEEAEILCDRLGIFVDGQLVCIGSPKELTARYGEYLVSPSMRLCVMACLS
jgi:ABC-type multidrug transport system ATPase subunit